MILESYGKSFTFDIVGLMNKTGFSLFTSRKVIASVENYGKHVQTTFDHYKILLDEVKKDEPLIQKKLE